MVISILRKPGEVLPLALAVGLGWALLTGAMIGCYTVADAHGVRAAPRPVSYIVWSFVLSGAAIVTMFGLASRGRIFAAALAQWKPGVAALATLLAVTSS